MGQALADSVGFAEPPMTVEDSAKGVLEQVCLFESAWDKAKANIEPQIDGLSAETSGKFLHVTGQELPW